MTSLSDGLKVEESQMIGMESNFFYRDYNRNSLILQGPKVVLTQTKINEQKIFQKLNG